MLASEVPVSKVIANKWMAKGIIGEKDGGERGIRTLGTPFGRTHDFQSCSFSQLGHLSAKKGRYQPSDTF
jgi:hypothetical protein